MRRIGIAAVAYFAAIAGVSLATPRRVVALGVAQCCDEGERDVRVYLVDDLNRQYQQITPDAAIPLSVVIPPQGDATTSRLFLVPNAARRGSRPGSGA